jgi:hypothetical protein
MRIVALLHAPRLPWVVNSNPSTAPGKISMLSCRKDRATHSAVATCQLREPGVVASLSASKPAAAAGMTVSPAAVSMMNPRELRTMHDTRIADIARLR